MATTKKAGTFDSFARMALGREFLGQGKAAANAEGLRSDFKAGRRLLALVLRAVHLTGDGADHFEGEEAFVGDFLGRPEILDIGLQDAIEVLIGRKRVLVLLIGAQFSRRGLSRSRRGECARRRDSRNPPARTPWFWARPRSRPGRPPYRHRACSIPRRPPIYFRC